MLEGLNALEKQGEILSELGLNSVRDIISFRLNARTILKFIIRNKIIVLFY